MRTNEILHDGIKAVIFDLDGTLLDTEKLLLRFWREAAAFYGYDMTVEQALTLRSLAHGFSKRLFTEWFGEDCDYMKLRNKRLELMRAFIEQNGVEVKKGAKELLEYLGEKGYMRAVATATDEKRAGTLLESAGLGGYFDRIICASMVKVGKPKPDIYIYAAEALGLSPDKCIAAEDSPNGVISAHDAGCYTVMIPDLTQPDSGIESHISAVCGDLAEIILLIEGSQRYEDINA